MVHSSPAHRSGRVPNHADGCHSPEPSSDHVLQAFSTPRREGSGNSLDVGGGGVFMLRSSLLGAGVSKHKGQKHAKTIAVSSSKACKSPIKICGKEGIEMSVSASTNFVLVSEFVCDNAAASAAGNTKSAAFAMGEGPLFGNKGNLFAELVCDNAAASAAGNTKSAAFAMGEGPLFGNKENLLADVQRNHKDQPSLDESIDEEELAMLREQQLMMMTMMKSGQLSQPEPQSQPVCASAELVDAPPGEPRSEIGNMNQGEQEEEDLKAQLEEQEMIVQLQEQQEMLLQLQEQQAYMAQLQALSKQGQSA